VLLLKTPPHTEGGLRDMQAEHTAEAFKERSREGFGENVSNVIRGADADKVGEALFYDVADTVILNTNVFDICMMGLVLSQ
jgi:hypothetical protein